MYDTGTAAGLEFCSRARTLLSPTTRSINPMTPLLTAAKATRISNVNAIPNLKNIAGKMIINRLTVWWTSVRPRNQKVYLLEIAIVERNLFEKWKSLVLLKMNVINDKAKIDNNMIWYNLDFITQKDNEEILFLV